MTFEIVFIHRSLGQSFDSAMEEAFEGDPASEQLRDSWYDRLQRIMRQSFGEVSVGKSAGTREITDPQSGLHLVLKGAGVIMEIPEAGSGTDDAELLQRAHILSKEIERVTGLEGWDTRLEKPTASMSGLLPPPSPSPAPPTATPAEQEAVEEAPETELKPQRKRWWRFGR